MRDTCSQCGGALPRSAALLFCESCRVTAKEVHAHVRRIHEALGILTNGADLATRLDQCDRIIREAEALARFEGRGLLTTTPPPSVILQDFRAKREALEHVEKADAPQG